jgi:uncharacterized protein
MNFRSYYKSLAYFGFFLWLLFILAIGQAQTPELANPKVQPEEADAGPKREDIKKLISIMGTEDEIKIMLPKIIVQMKQMMPQVPDKFWQDFEHQVDVKELVELYVPIYDKHYTHEEIKGMIEFYNTPLGKKVLTTMPKVMQESMDAGSKWGAALEMRIEKKMSERGTNDIPSEAASTQKTLTPQGKLTDYQKRWVVQQSGYDTNEYQLSDDEKYIIPKVKADPVVKQPPVGLLPTDVRYMIQFRDSNGLDTTYFSKEEPKPFGNGFKFKIYPTDIEITVSGNVQIIKLPKN